MSRQIKPNEGLRGRSAQVLLALRAGPMTSEQMEARFGTTSSARILIGLGYVEIHQDPCLGQAFRLTEKGRIECPSRRALCATSEATLSAREERLLGLKANVS